MNNITNQTAAISSTPKRVILANAYRHELHSTNRQEQARKTIRKMGRFDDNEILDRHGMRRISSADGTLDE